MLRPVTGYLLFFAVAGAGLAAGPALFQPHALYRAAQEKLQTLDSGGRLILAAYKEGAIEGRFADGTFVYYSPKLVEGRSRYDSYQVVVRGGRVHHATQILMQPSEAEIPGHLPAEALKAAREWWLEKWWAGNRDARLELVLRAARESDNVWSSVRWIWKVTGWGDREDCIMLLDGESLKRLRITIEPLPDPTPPSADHWK